MRMFQKDEKKPGKVVLSVGICAWVITAAIGLAWSSRNPYAPDMFGVLILLPPFLCLLTLLAIPALVIQGMLAGASGFSIGYALSMMNRNLRGIAGGILICAAVAAAAYGIAHAVGRTQ